MVDVASRAVLGGERAGRSRLGDRVLLAVSDGLGGQPGGEIASAVVVETLARAMLWARTATPREELLDAAVQVAHRAVQQAAVTHGKLGMGATLVAALVDGPTAYVAEVGDSRVYLLRGGSLAQISHDQSMVQAMIDEGMMDAEDKRTFPFRSVILQSMGMDGAPRVALRRVDLRRGDLILLCSDGLTELVPDPDIKRVLLAAPRLDVACSALVDLANARGGVDNITVVLAKAGGELPPGRAGETIASTVEVLRSFA